MPDALAAALADRYRIERELGQGGMATVYLAHDLRHDREVALKVLRPELAAVLGAERFLKEIRTTAGLQHPHIVPLFDSGQATLPLAASGSTASTVLYYVLPYIRGESLRDRLNREQQLDIEEALAITRQVGGALDYAHRQGVIHRDIKPENILLHEGEAVLADFGIALAVRQAAGDRLTQTGLSLGTPQYMSPEQATGDRQPDARSDLYSLAAVLYEMLAGEPPHTGPTAQAVIARLMTERPTRLRVLRDTVPESVDAAVARALAKTPADRQKSAAEFVSALSAAPAGGAGATTRFPRFRVPALPVALVAVAVLAAFVALRRPAERVVVPERIQLTFTGNARTPALSADGRRLAYSTRQCDSAGACSTDLVVQDLGGAGATTLLRDWASIDQVEWTGDGRYLLVSAFEGGGGNWGLYAVPTLGGRPRHLGRYYGSLQGISDTVVAARVAAGDSVTWLRWITLADGVVRDSLRLPRGLNVWFRFRSFADGRRLLLVRGGVVGWVAIIMDRGGRPIDSLVNAEPGVSLIGLAPDGRTVLAGATAAFREGHPGLDILAWRIHTDGKVAQRPDTVLQGLEGEAWVAPDGSLLLQSGPLRREVWALHRPGPATLEFTQRKLGSATGLLEGRLSPDGDQVLLQRQVRVDDRPVVRFSLVPFEGGDEIALELPEATLGASWGPTGRHLYLFRRDGDTMRVSQYDVATGADRPAWTFAWRWLTGVVASLPAGGVLFSRREPVGLWRVGAPGQPDTIFALGEHRALIRGLDVSPDGRAAVWVGWDATGDSVLVERISLADGGIQRLAAFYPYDVGRPFWLDDGTIIVGIEETEATLAWYRVFPRGGTPVRLGSPPRFPAQYLMSRDGRRVLATVTEDSPDVYVIRNFPRLLE